MAFHPSHHVLVVDPEDDVRDCLVLYLQLQGFHTLGTRDSSGTLRALRAGFRPCVVLTDPRVHGADGWELLAYVRDDSVLAKVPTVLASANAMDRRRALRRGVVAAIEKPVAPAHWIEVVERECRYRWWLRAPVERPAVGASSGERRRA